MSRYSEPNIVFSEKDASGVRQPHDGPLVIMLKMEEFNMHQVLISKHHLSANLPTNEAEQGKVMIVHFPIGKFHRGQGYSQRHC